MRFSTQTLLVVGATSGIGHALALRLLGEGATLITVARRPAPGLVAAGAQHLELDITGPEAGARLAAALPETLHGLAYLPGSIRLRPFERLSADEFRADFDLNVMGAVVALQAAAPRLKRAGGAGVALVSTVAAQTGMAFHASVAAAKAAVEGLGRALAAEWAPQRVRVNVVAPALTDTPLAAALLSTPEKAEAAARRHPLGRVGTADDVAATLAWLLSADAAFVTGQVVGVDGGLGVLK